MPFVSPAQRAAMYAAAAGKSTIGIPQKAAQSFVSHARVTALRSPKQKNPG